MATGRINPKKESTFGKPKSSWGFGKPKPREFGDVADINNVYIPGAADAKRIAEASKKKRHNRDVSQKIKMRERLDKQKEKRGKSKSDKKGTLIIKDYMTYLHGEATSNIEVHHWMPKSRIQQNDFFVCRVSPEVHREIHADKTVNWYIEKVGIENLLVDSLILFTKWMGTDSGKSQRYAEFYVEMISDINADPENFEHVLAMTKRCEENIRYKKRGV